MDLQNFASALQNLVTSTQSNMEILFKILGFFWVIFLITRVFPQILYLGIRPRRTEGLAGILFAPLLHQNIEHLFFNSILLFILSDFLLMHGFEFYLNISISITLISGILLWCFGKNGIHLGASGVIAGYWSYLVYDAYLNPKLSAIILMVICVYYFSGILFSALPGQRGISWEGHLFGLMAGLMVHFI